MYSIKIVLCGEGGVGKTSIAYRFTKGEFPTDIKLTVGIEHFTKVIEVNGKQAKIVLWDLGGEERFRFLAPVFLKGAKGGLFVFDVTRLTTLFKLDEWLKIFREQVGDVPVVLVGNKVDLSESRAVFREAAEEFAKTKGFLAYYEVSAKTGVNVEEAFMHLIKAVLEKIQL
ncbi:MAG: hypothetical protein DRN04_05360 [Thermoprotei archaeon]|nr:MAG: hypothetical protein DRN04_05360 [Thermoprotei archaeon]